MEKIAGLIFIIVGIGFFYKILAYILKYKKLQNLGFETMGTIEEIILIPDAYNRITSKYSIKVKYFDNQGKEYFNSFLYPQTNTKIGDKLNVLVNTNIPKESILVDDNLVGNYIFLILTLIFMLLGFWIALQ
jgi:hypothetical protein